MWSKILVLLLLAMVVIWMLQRWKRVAHPQCRYECHWQTFPFQVGDILLNCAARSSRFAGDCQWGHVAMVAQDPVTQLWYVWEMQIPPVGVWRAMTTSLQLKGARLCPLQRYLERMQPVCVRQWSQPIEASALWQVIRQQFYEPFAFDYLVRGINCMFPLANFPLSRRKRNTGRYCAEFMGDTLTRLGILRKEANRLLLPRDFSNDESSNLLLQPGWSLGPEILLLV